jgi:hypothetical protein
MAHSAHPQHRRRRRLSAAVTALAATLLAIAGGPVPLASGRSAPGVDPLAQVVLTAAPWTADGAAVVVERDRRAAAARLRTGRPLSSPRRTVNACPSAPTALRQTSSATEHHTRGPLR